MLQSFRKWFWSGFWVPKHLPTGYLEHYGKLRSESKKLTNICALDHIFQIRKNLKLNIHLKDTGQKGSSHKGSDLVVLPWYYPSMNQKSRGEKQGQLLMAVGNLMLLIYSGACCVLVLFC